MKRRHSLFSILTVLACFCLLSACGFSMRGATGDFKLPFNTLFVNTGSTTFFGTTLKRHIESTGTKIVTNSKQADVRLEILQNERKREILSLSTAGRVREYALFYIFRFQVLDRENRILMAPAEIRLRRTLTYSESQAYAKEKEADMLYEDMENDVMLQVIRRLANIEVQTGLSGEKEPGL